MKKEVIIETYHPDLSGKFTVDKKSYSVKGVIEKEKVLVDLSQNGAKLLKVITPSPLRIMPKCQVYHMCGGCSLQHLRYEEQLKLKTKLLEMLFKKHLKLNITIPLVIGSTTTFGYRNKNQMVLKKSPNGLKAGMYEEGTHNVIDVENCLIQDPIINEIQVIIKKLLIKYRYQAYDEDKQKGIFRHVLIKRSASSQEVLVVFVTGVDNFPGKNNFIKELLKIRPDITTIIQNINNKKSSAVLGSKEVILYGPGFIFDYLLGMKFRITSKSFYQVNSRQTEVLYKLAIQLAKLEKTDILLDAYSGVGTIGILASPFVKKVISVEIGSEAVKCAKLNAKYNNIQNIDFYCEDATKFILKLATELEKIDVIIMDPPRTGSTKEFLEAVKKLMPKKIIYVSCNPETQVKDLGYLQDVYKIEALQGVDMFPETAHVETVCLLSKRYEKAHHINN